MTTGHFCYPVSTLPLASPLVNCPLWVSLSNSSRVPFLLPVASRSRAQAFVWFRAKTDKGIVCLADNLHSVTWLKEGKEEAVVWCYQLELSSKPLLYHLKPMKYLNWSVLIIAMVWAILFLGKCNYWFQIFQVTSVFMHNNACSHVCSLPREFFEHKKITGEKIMEWPTSSWFESYRKSIVNYYMKLYESRNHYSKAEVTKIENVEVKNKITKSMGNRQLAVIILK